MAQHLLLAGREINRPIEIGEAVLRAVLDRPSADASLYIDSKGELMLIAPWPSEEEAKAKHEYLSRSKRTIKLALSGGWLNAYVYDPVQHNYLRIPRSYWLNHDLGVAELETIEAASGWRAELVGQPIIVPLEDVAEWRTVIANLLDEERQREERAAEIANEKPVDIPAKRRRRSRSFPYDEGLSKIMNHHHAAISEATNETHRKEIIASYWRDGWPALPGERAITKRWIAHVDKRANTR